MALLSAHVFAAVPSWASDLHGLVAVAYLTLWVILLYATQDSREPPLAPCSIPIPFIGPIIEMQLKGTRFPLYMK